MALTLSVSELAFQDTEDVLDLGPDRTMLLFRLRCEPESLRPGSWARVQLAATRNCSNIGEEVG